MIDEKGRLFGKINVIDFLVILFFISLFPIFYFSYNSYSARRRTEINEQSEKAVFIKLEISCEFAMLDPEIVKLIAVGDKELDENNEVIGEIIWVGEARQQQYKLDIKAKEKLIQTDPFLKNVSIRLRVKAKIKNDTIYYKDRQIAVNSPIIFRTDKYTLEAIPFQG